MKVKLYHYPQCSKSREALILLEEQGADIEVIEYLKQTPSKEELAALIRKLGIEPFDLVRKKEPIYLEKYEGKKLSPAKWIDAMVRYPILIERPIVIKGNKALIGRPVERVLEILR